MDTDSTKITSNRDEQINAGYMINFRLLRSLMGLIAVTMPIVVSLRAQTELSSISASYHSDAQDIFVGLLFAVGTFLFAYRGTEEHNKIVWLPKIGALGAFAAALYPISPDGRPMDASSWIHNIAAISLFFILAYICLGIFKKRAEGKIIEAKRGNKSSDRKLNRYKLYTVCGYGIIASILIVAAFWLSEHFGLIPKGTLVDYRIIYIGEGIALGCFGTAWMIAGRWWIFKCYVDDAEAYRPFKRRTK